MSDMGPNIDLQGRSNISREALGNKRPIGVIKEVGNNHMNNTSNGEHKGSDMQVGTSSQSKGAFINLDSGVNMHEGKKSGNIKQVGVEGENFDVDLTESSSSFDSDGTSFNDAEDDLELYDDALSGFPFDGYNELFQVRKKKLAPSWKKHVEPLKWRCKWVELQIKKFELQAQKYESEIAEYNRREQLENSNLENVNSVSLQFSAQSQKKAVMRRKNRRRVEDTEDISSYMSQHNLFSYFGSLFFIVIVISFSFCPFLSFWVHLWVFNLIPENKNSTADAGGTDGNLSNQGAGKENPSNGTTGNRVKEESISREFKERGNILEQIFWTIGTKQWKLREMRIRVHKVLSENASRFSSNENSSLLMSCNNSLTSSAENPPSPLKNEDEIIPVASSISNKNVYDGGHTKMVDVAMPESETSPAIGGSSRNPTGTILMYNRRAKMNRNKSKEVNIVSSQKPRGSTEDHQASSSNDPSFQVPGLSPPKMISLSKMMANNTGSTSFKRKRAMRKAGSGKWNQ